VEAAKFFQSLKDILPIKAADIKADIKTSLFTEGKLAMNVSGPWQTQEFIKGVKNLGVMEYPTLPNGKPMMPFSGVKGFLVNASTKYPIAAKMFAQLITSEEFQVKNFEMFGSLPANKNVAASEKVSSDPFASVFLKQFDNSTPMPKIAEMNAFWSTHEAVLSSLWNDKADPQKTMDDWAKKMKDAIASSK
jgi:arabinogalactan oligomer/maltooligosaccharide transport system substrate-binding protein